MEIVLRTLNTFIDVYKAHGPTTNGFTNLMWRCKHVVMDLVKWPAIKAKVYKHQVISMFNFKVMPKQPMLKVQYLKHLHIVDYLYDQFLVAYGRLSWNDKVPHYFSKFTYAKFF